MGLEHCSLSISLLSDGSNVPFITPSQLHLHPSRRLLPTLPLLLPPQTIANFKVQKHGYLVLRRQRNRYSTKEEGSPSSEASSEHEGVDVRDDIYMRPPRAST
jgi:hypothetical protein